MSSKFRSLSKISQKIRCSWPSGLVIEVTDNLLVGVPFQHGHEMCLRHFTSSCEPAGSFPRYVLKNSFTNDEAKEIQTVLKLHAHKPVEEFELSLTQCNLSLSKDLILHVLKHNRFDWKPAYLFFNWVRKFKNVNAIFLDACIYNEILDILCRMKQFVQAHQLLYEMFEREGLIDVRSFAIMVCRYCQSHKVDDAIEFFHKVEDFGLENDSVAFQTLLSSLCRSKHVEVAELVFRSRKSEYKDDIKIWNIILNGWCVLGSFSDVKRFWKDILASDCKPDKFTYGIFINSLSKSGKISTAKKLLQTMWEQGGELDTAIYNSVIDGLCFKKRIPEALEIFGDMKLRGCSPNAATYNALIKHLCKIQRMEKVHELLNEMEGVGGCCLPNSLTYNHFLSSAKTPEEADKILQRMEISGCQLLGDTYNLILRLFMKWGDEERVQKIWDEMKESGTGPDQRSYTVMIHSLHDYGRIKDSMEYYIEMRLKRMVPEPRTKSLMDIKLQKI